MAERKGEPTMLILTLDDAVTVTKQLVADDMDDAEIIRQELEQKCWFLQNRMMRQST